MPPPSFVPTSSPAKVIAACPFLDADEIRKALQDGNIYDSTEEAPIQANGHTAYICSYRRSDTDEALGKLGTTASNVAPEVSLHSVQQRCNGTVMPIDGAGDASMFCASAAGTTIFVAKRSHGGVRAAILGLTDDPAAVEFDAYRSLAKLVGGRM